MELMNEKEEDEDLIRRRTEFLENLSEIPDGMAKQVIVAANLEIKRLEKTRKEASKVFNKGLFEVKNKTFCTATVYFDWAARLRKETGEEQEEALAREKQAECWLQRREIETSYIVAGWARKIYKKIGDQEGLARIKLLRKKIKQKEKQRNKSEGE
jgi:hypothetical protein